MKKRISLKKLFDNNYFVLAVSFVLALIIWAVVTVEKTPETTVTIRDVPVSIDYNSVEERLNLTAFDATEYTVNVTITGKRYLVDTADIKGKISVTADVSGVTGAGRAELYLDTQINGDRESFRIDSISRNSVSVYFDYSRDAEFTVVPEIKVNSAQLPDGYVMGNLEVLEGKTIRVSGPESEVNKITGLKAYVPYDTPFTETKSIDTEITIEFTDSVNTSYITLYRGQSNTEAKNVKVSVPIYKIVTLPAEITVKGKPAEYNALSYSVSPANITIGVPESRADTMKSFELKNVNYNDINTGKQEFTVTAKELDSRGILLMDENQTFKVTIEANNVVSKDITAPTAIECENAPDWLDNLTATPTFSTIKVIGPADVLQNLNTDNIVLMADVSNVDFEKEGTYEVPVNLVSDNSWIYGTYNATVEVG